MSDIVVLGAGVIGLTTALFLQQRGYQVAVIAKHVPGDMSIEYTSPYAGAHWRSFATHDNKLLQRIESVTYHRLMSLSTQNTGIMVLPSLDYYDVLTPETVDPWFKDTVTDFTFIPQQDLPGNAKIGHQYTTVVVNTPFYLRWLLSEFKKLGGTLQQHTVSHITDLFHLIQPLRSVINCTGLGSRFIGGIEDKKMYPTRGQTVMIHAPFVNKTLTHIGDHGISYVIPRTDGSVILGGTANTHDYNPFPNDKENQFILEQAKILYPELKKEPIQIIQSSVGLRPTRSGGPRFENEWIVSPLDPQHRVKVTHGYGHGGYGVQSSWGSAEYIIELMERRSQL
ncbi:FAD dependent oxidoreductase [Pilobolus umbonatus]|nr:FAD dependent oxidoreductase [Pilobolus umbonatus]